MSERSLTSLQSLWPSQPKPVPTVLPQCLQCLHCLRCQPPRGCPECLACWRCLGNLHCLQCLPCTLCFGFSSRLPRLSRVSRVPCLSVVFALSVVDGIPMSILPRAPAPSKVSLVPTQSAMSTLPRMSTSPLEARNNEVTFVGLRTPWPTASDRCADRNRALADQRHQRLD